MHTLNGAICWRWKYGAGMIIDHEKVKEQILVSERLDQVGAAHLSLKLKKLIGAQFPTQRSSHLKPPATSHSQILCY